MANTPRPTSELRVDRGAIRHLQEVRGKPTNPCAYFHRGWCKRGRKCPDPHTHDVLRGTKIPFVSCNVDEIGDRQLVMRPPFTEALSRHYQRAGNRNNGNSMLHLGHRMGLYGRECVPFTPQDFMPPDRASAESASVAFGTYAANKVWWPGSSVEAGLFGHGTSVEYGLEIADDQGVMFTSKGKCGRGAYFSALGDIYHQTMLLKSCGTKHGVTTEGALS